jgi:type IV pilus biogenesis protein PilP
MATLVQRARQQQQREQARAAPAAAAAAAPQSTAATRVQPSGQTSTTVAAAATIDNAINLGRINLIGVYGRLDDRRALVRLPGGRYVRVAVGDRLDGGQVSSIGDGFITYARGGRNVRLDLPG